MIRSKQTHEKSITSVSLRQEHILVPILGEPRRWVGACDGESDLQENGRDTTDAVKKSAAANTLRGHELVAWKPS